MSQSVDLCYLYDGTYDGLLTCVFESYRRREEYHLLLPQLGRDVGAAGERPA